MKQLLISICFFTISTITVQALAGSGSSLVGNGAGIVENSFIYHYSKISKIIETQLSTQDHQFSDPNFRLLYKIQLILKKYPDPTKKLVFLSGKSNPGFFQTSDNETHRIAKTYLTPKSLIYINTDHLYKLSGEAAIDDGTIISILAHELGHQAGETNHQKLDYLGAQLRQSISEKITSSFIKDTSDQKEIKLTTVHIENSTYSDVTLYWKNKTNFMNISSYIYKRLSTVCIEQSLNSIYIGSKIVYTRLAPSNSNQTDYLSAIKIILFSEVYCSDASTNTINTMNIELKFNINENFEFLF